MSTLRFLRAINEAKEKGLIVTIKEGHSYGQIVLTVSPLSPTDSVELGVYATAFLDKDIKGQSDFIEYATRQLGEE